MRLVRAVAMTTWVLGAFIGCEDYNSTVVFPTDASIAGKQEAGASTDSEPALDGLAVDVAALDAAAIEADAPIAVDGRADVSRAVDGSFIDGSFVDGSFIDGSPVDVSLSDARMSIDTTKGADR